MGRKGRTSARASAAKSAPTIRSCATGSFGNASLAARNTREETRPSNR